MKAKVMKITVLMIALMVAGWLKAGSTNAPWSQTALAEESVAVTDVGNVGDLRIGSADMWNQSYADLVAELDAAEITVRKVGTGDNVFHQVVAEKMAVSDYVADELTFMYHDGDLCMYSYKFEEQCSEARFNYLLDALNTKYGPAVKKAFSFKNMSNCPMFEALDEIYAALAVDDDEELGWADKAVKGVANLFTATPGEVYEWNVGGHTKISLCYSKKNSILARDNFYILYSSQIPHGQTLVFQEVEKEYNVDGL